MDVCKSCNNVDAALIDHRVVSCNAEALVKPSPKQGGYVEISFSIETQPDIDVTKKDTSYWIRTSISVTGKHNAGDDPAFRVACKIEGIFIVQECVGAGFSPDDSFALTMSSARQLYPLTSFYAADLISKIGYKNIRIPPFQPSEYALQKPAKAPKKPKKQNKKTPDSV